MCEPGTQMVLNVSSETQGISLQPSLRFPNVLGIRVEVMGQVLSQGGDVGADQIADTSAAKPDRWAVASCLSARCEQNGTPGGASQLPRQHLCCQDRHVMAACSPHLGVFGSSSGQTVLSTTSDRWLGLHIF